MWRFAQLKYIELNGSRCCSLRAWEFFTWRWYLWRIWNWNFFLTLAAAICNLRHLISFWGLGECEKRPRCKIKYFVKKISPHCAQEDFLTLSFLISTFHNSISWFVACCNYTNTLSHSYVEGYMLACVGMYMSIVENLCLFRHLLLTSTLKWERDGKITCGIFVILKEINKKAFPHFFFWSR